MVALAVHPAFWNDQDPSVFRTNVSMEAPGPSPASEKTIKEASVAISLILEKSSPDRSRSDVSVGERKRRPDRQLSLDSKTRPSRDTSCKRVMAGKGSKRRCFPDGVTACNSSAQAPVGKLAANQTSCPEGDQATPSRLFHGPAVALVLPCWSRISTLPRADFEILAIPDGFRTASTSSWQHEKAASLGVCTPRTWGVENRFRLVPRLLHRDPTKHSHFLPTQNSSGHGTLNASTRRVCAAYVSYEPFGALVELRGPIADRHSSLRSMVNQPKFSA